MSNSESNVDRVLDLAEAVCDENASQRDLGELDSIVRADQACGRHYLGYCQMHVALRLELRAKRAAQKVRNRPAPGRSLPCPSESDVPRGGAPSTMPLSFLGDAIHGTVGYFASGWPMAYLVATVVFAIGLLIGDLVHVSQPTQTANHSVRPSKAGIASTRDVVGRITGMADCRWQGAGARGQGAGREMFQSLIPSPQSLVALGDKFALVSGLLEITYDTGAKVILQGPVTYEVESAAGGFLAIGKLTARLEKRGERRGERGENNAIHQIPNPKSQIASPSPLSPLPSPLFVVRTPTATVTDLGTEFGVQVDRAGMTTTTVFRGSIAMRAIVKDDNSPNPGTILRENESACVQNVGGNADEHRYVVSRTANTPTGFVRTLPQQAVDRDGEAYARLVLAMKPVVYYRMSKSAGQADRTVLFDSATGGCHGELRLADTNRSPCGPGRFGEALYLRGPMTNDHAIVRHYPQTDAETISVSAWVWADALDVWGTIIQGKPLPLSATDQHFDQFFLGVNRDLVLTATALDRDGKEIVAQERGTVLPRGRWHHVALVADGATLHLYRNGVEVASSPCEGIDRRRPAKILAIGGLLADLDAQLRREYPACWNGRLDEIAMFNHALTAAEIAALYAGKPELPGGKTPPAADTHLN